MWRSHLDDIDETPVLDFADPALYRIVIQGQLDFRTAEHVGDVLRIESRGSRVMNLLVRVLDQAGLRGVLSSLYGFHLSILSVQYVNDEEEGKS